MEHSVKAYKGMGMEGTIARWYAKNTLRDLEEFKQLARRLGDELPAGSRILEVAPGPGYLAIELARQRRYEVAAIDISKSFVEIARQNAAKANVAVDFQQGNASAMPFEGDGFDLVVCRAAFKNFSEPVKALGEMWRVLKPGGRALIIDLRRDVSQHAVNQYIDKMGVGFLNGLVMKLTFRFMLIKRAYTKEEFRQFAAQTPFSRYEIDEGPIGFEVWFHK